MASEDFLEVYFMGLVIGGNYYGALWCLVIIVMCVGLGQAEVKRCGGDFTVIN